MPKSTRRNVVIPDPLWARAERAARALAEREGVRVTVSDVVRRALDRETRAILRKE